MLFISDIQTDSCPRLDYLYRQRKEKFAQNFFILPNTHHKMSSDTDTQDPGMTKDNTPKEETPAEPPPAPTGTTEMPPPTKTPGTLEKEQEAKLRAKYPGLRGSNPLLQKRLSKGQKYFDSGDYNMAKASKKPILPGQTVLLGAGTGQAHPTPDSVPVRKTSIVQPGLHLS